MGLIHRLLAGPLTKVTLQMHPQTNSISKPLSPCIYTSKQIQPLDEMFSEVRSPEIKQNLTLPNGLRNGSGKSLNFEKGSSKRTSVGLRGFSLSLVVEDDLQLRKEGSWPDTSYRAFSGRKCLLMGHSSRIWAIVFETSA